MEVRIDNPGGTERCGLSEMLERMEDRRDS